MTADRRPKYDAPSLEITLDSRGLPVSYLSSLLRVVQAALREVARSDQETLQLMSQQPQPVLHVSASNKDDDLILHFAFADPLDSQPLPELSSPTFDAFVEQLGELIKGLPQRNLWGESVGGPGRGSLESEVARRLDQLRLELRRFPRARLSFNRHTITFEGGRMEIE